MSDKMPQVISLESELVGVEQKSEGVELERIRIIFYLYCLLLRLEATLCTRYSSKTHLNLDLNCRQWTCIVVNLNIIHWLLILHPQKRK